MTVRRVGVLGAAGRMGATVCEAVAGDPALELVAAVDPSQAGRTASGVAISGELEAVRDAGAEVVVDFTVAEAVRENLPVLAGWGVHGVVGTTGLAAADLEALRGAFTRSNCLVAPNFAIGAVLMMRFAELAAPFFESAEIIELHHDQKVDAPSGTSLATAERMAAASGTWSPDPTRQENLAGARGGCGPTGIHVHSVRLRGLVAHQEVLLGTTAQLLTLRHDSYDRTSFMPGVLLAVKRGRRPPRPDRRPRRLPGPLSRASGPLRRRTSGQRGGSAGRSEAGRSEAGSARSSPRLRSPVSSPRPRRRSMQRAAQDHDRRDDQQVPLPAVEEPGDAPDRRPEHVPDRPDQRQAGDGAGHVRHREADGVHAVGAGEEGDRVVGRHEHDQVARPPEDPLDGPVERCPRRGAAAPPRARPGRRTSSRAGRRTRPGPAAAGRRPAGTTRARCGG